MTISLQGRRILLGVSGSIAAYKAADIASQLGKLGADVHVILSVAAARFVGEPTLRALTRNPVLTDVFDEPYEHRIAHIEIAQSADLLLIAPATANTLAKLAHGLADDMLSTVALATTAPLLIAPAMNAVMLAHPATQANLATLMERGAAFVEPQYGLLACQTEGWGKLADVEVIVQAVVESLTPTVRDLQGLRVVVTAGATREPLDPVRFLSNRSSGRMGYALAEAAARRGASVMLISGQTALPIPPNVERILVTTTAEMLTAAQAHFSTCDFFFAAAAPADFTPLHVATQKIKKRNGSDSGEITLTLRETPDIVATLSAQKKGQFVVGFAAETENLLEQAREKMRRKRLDMIVANDVTQAGAGFEVETNIVTLLTEDGRVESLPLLPKSQVAERILTGALILRNARQPAAPTITV